MEKHKIKNIAIADKIEPILTRLIHFQQVHYFNIFLKVETNFRIWKYYIAVQTYFPDAIK